MSERRPAAARRFDARTHYRGDDVAAGYDRARFRGASGALVDWLERRLILRALRAAPASRTVLDMPVGTGRMLPILRAAGYAPSGADISEAMLLRAYPRAAGALLVAADGAALPVRDAAFDAVVSLRLFPHLDAPERMRLLREMARVTRYAVIPVYQPHRASVWYVARNMILRQRQPRHFVAHRDIVREAAACGLRLHASFALLPGVFMERAYVFVPAQEGT